MLLEIKGLRVSYKIGKDSVEVVRGFDLEIQQRECIGLAGESGCGKTTVGLSITRLIPEQKSSIIAGRIFFQGNDILALDSEGLRKIRGKRISYVFQDPFSSLNPVFTIHSQLEECLPADDNPQERIPELLESVGLSKIAGNKKIFPHELSGGMQQRVMIAMAIASKPDLLILDEPTTALDVSTQSQILSLIMELKDRLNLSILFISHDLKTIFNLADRVAIMYAGKILEIGSKKEIVSQPAHPYTKGLIDSIPSFEHRKKRFNAIEGRTALFSNLPQGCKFHPRCRFRINKCTGEEPCLDKISLSHAARCIRAKELMEHGTNRGA
jgi:oligopeptide/dipeptide ABC transporter ATP-binding protein